MTLVGPILDDRTYAQLRDELVARIPVHSPEWTNHNASDPGVALLELFAHLGESLLFRFNQIPEATQVAFLRLLGVRPRPARPAQVLLAATTDRPEGVAVERDAEVLAGAVPFRTEQDLYVWPLDCLAAAKTAAVPGGTPGESERRRDALERLGLPATTAAQFYETTVLAPDPGAPDARPVDVAATLDRALWVALLRRPTTDEQLLAGRGVYLGVAFDEQIEAPFALHDLDPAQVEALRSTGLSGDPLPTAWELWNGPGGTPAFRTLVPDADTTRGMATSGVVALTLPDPLPTVGDSAGDGASPPPLPDEEQAEAVVAWLRVSRPATARNDPLRRVRWVGVNAVGAVQARTAAPELLGTGTGEPDQVVTLAHAPVLEGTLRLQVEEPTGWQDWTEGDGIERPGADRTVVVDHAAGTVSFGRHGRVPQLGERIRTLGYRHGGGTAGNVAAGAVTGALGTSGAMRATNPLPAAGGADAAALPDALAAVPAELHRRDRAVTAEDFRDLARQVTGVARAETLPLFHPDAPLVAAAGVVTVVVLPVDDTASPTAPLPDHALLGRVARHLDVRRLVTTELYVVPPTYRPLAVSVGVAVRTGYQVDAVRRWVEQILRQYLGPLPPDGPDGAGWPLGRTVRAAELEAVAVQVEGVEFLTGLRLAGPAGGADLDRVLLQRWELPTLGDVTVVSGTAPPPPVAPGSPSGPTPAPGSDTVPVPLPPDVC